MKRWSALASEPAGWGTWINALPISIVIARSINCWSGSRNIIYAVDAEDASNAADTAIAAAIAPAAAAAAATLYG